MYKQGIGIILSVSFLVGCAAPQIRPIRRGEPIAILFSQSAPAAPVYDIKNEEIGSNSSTGAKSGAVSGAVTGALLGLSCGPFAFFCSPVMAAAGVVAGAITGAGVGAGVGVTGALSNEKAVQLRDRMIRVQQSHPVLAELQKNVNDRAQKHWKLDADQSVAVVTVELQDLLLSSTRDEKIKCKVKVVVSVHRDAGKNPTSKEQKEYEYVAPATSLSIWLDESSDFVDTFLTSANQQIAAQIVSDLAESEALVL